MSFNKVDLTAYLKQWGLIQENRPDVAPVTASQLERLDQLLREKAARRLEGLALYEPMKSQAAFHACKAPERILRGSNRAGKTLPAAVEIARAVLGKDPHDKYPRENGRCFVVGNSEKHLRETMFPKLCKAGAFRIIRDEETGLWRAWHPNNPADADRKKLSKPAPPLIPPRLIKSIAWKSKKLSIPELVTLKTGWEMAFFTAGTKPPKGVAIHLGWFDEEVEDEDWYPEIAARLLDFGGLFVWSATPEAGTQQLWELSERAAEQANLPEPLTVEFFMHIDENQFLSKKEKDIFVAKIFDPEVAKVKIGGEFSRGLSKIFPEFNQTWHCVKPLERMSSRWTYYASIDPGYQVCAVLLFAVPPPKEEDSVYLYDEIYIPQCTAEKFARAMRSKCMGRTFQNFIIDQKGAAISDAGTGLTWGDMYARALARHRVQSVESGSGFTLGNPSNKAGIEAVREWLRIREETNSPKLRVVEESCPNFVEEIKRYRYKRDKNGTTDEPETRGRVHAMAALRYMASYNPVWVKPVSRVRNSPALQAFKAKQKRMKAARGKSVAFMGPCME